MDIKVFCNFDITESYHIIPSFINFQRSISGEEKEEKGDKTKTAKIAERLAKKREKLLSMKRCSGYLKRPEILETVYSVEVKGDKLIFKHKIW